MTEIQYPVDIKIDSSRDVFLDQTGDLATHGGKPNLEQSLAIEVGDVINRFIGEPVTGGAIGRVEERLRQALNADPQVEEILSVEITKVNRQNKSVTFDIRIDEDEDFRISV